MNLASREDQKTAVSNMKLRTASPTANMKDRLPQQSTGQDSCTQVVLVKWHDDPSNPHNWPAARKYTVTVLLSAFTFNTLMSSTMVAPALSQIRKDLNITTDTETQLVLSIYVLAYAVGYFLWAPLSEVYGRQLILQAANMWFCIWNLVCGFSKNEATITIGRLFSGAGAAASLALGTGTMGEIWRPVQRGRSLAILSTITLLGPCIGPILGGAISERSPDSWRWVFWSTSIFNALLQLISFRFLFESHAPTILRRQARVLGKAEKQNHASPTPRTTIKVLAAAFKRPVYLLFTQPASQGLVVYTGLSFGCLYTVLSVIPIAFTEVYQQSLTVASLNYISFAIGTTIGAQTCAPTIDYLYRRKIRQHKENLDTAADADGTLEANILRLKAPAELRLYPFTPAILLMVCGLLVFGWCLNLGKHWILPNTGIAIFGAGTQAMTQCTNAYVIDIYCDIEPPPSIENNASRRSLVSINWSASAMASIWATKSLGGFAFPLFAVDLVRQLGWGWMGTLLAMLNLAVGLPVAILLLVYGRKLREVGRKRIESQLEDNRM